MKSKNFEANMTVGEALALHPDARWVFAAYHIGGCDGCSQADHETLLEVAAGYKLPLEKFLADLNALTAADS
jgi:hybrid cluster-associated redox disulfide protein